MSIRDEVKSHDVVLVGFSAAWCGPCRMMKPVLEGISKEYTVIKVDVDEDEGRDFAANYGINAVPTYIVFRNGEESKRFVGVQKKEALLTSLAEQPV